MKTKKKLIILISALLALIVATVGVTFAIGDADTPESDPGFTVTIGESTHSLRIIPGKTDTLNNSSITVNTDRDAWVFASVLDNATSGGTDYISYEMADGWTELKDEQGEAVYRSGSETAKVFYQEIKADASTERQLQLFKNNEITYPETLTNEDLENASGLSLTVWTQTTQQLGFTSAFGAYAGNFEKADNGSFVHVFPHTDTYLYRVGNGNTVKLGSLFEYYNEADEPANDTVDSTKVKIKAEAMDSATTVKGNGTNLENGSTAQCIYTVNNASWLDSTLKFTGEGPVKITISKDGVEKELYLEVVNANNATTATSASSANIVLLNDVATNSISIASGKTLYGNGFTVRDSRTNTGTTSGFVTLNGGTADNVRFVGYEPEEHVTSGITNQGYAPAIYSQSGGSLYNCYVSGGRYGIALLNGTLYMEGTTIDGGALGNMQLSGGEAILRDCTTTTTTNNGLKGLGIHVTTADAKLTLEGTFTQYNWLKQSEVPSTYSGVLANVYTSNSEFAYTYNGERYVNMGVLFLSEANNITEEQARAVITDTTGNNYGYIQQTTLGHTGTCYTSKKEMGSEAAINGIAYDEMQYDTLPAFSFDYTTKNYIPKTEDSSEFCYYDSSAKKVMVSFEKTNADTTFDYDPMILTAFKYGNELTYTVSMNGTDYTDQGIPLAESGEYVLEYSVTDPYVYDAETGRKTEHIYKKYVTVNVTAIEPEARTYYTDFTYVSSWANNAKKVIINNTTYVMPDVSGTSNAIGSTTVGGQTVYYPIVSVSPTSSNGNTAYSNGKGYYFAPVFNAINITDYNQDTGAAQYTYNASATQWPHGKAQGTGPDAAVFGYANGAAFANQPYGRNMNSQYYGYGRNNNGLCYTSNEIEKDNTASSHLVQYHYVANDGTTYYWYIRYDFAAMTYSAGSCITGDTLITLADGTQKAVKDLDGSEQLLAWNFMTGQNVAVPTVFIDQDEEKEYEVITARFDDGTEVEIITEHGFFDLDRGEYVYFDAGAAQYIGDRFFKDDNGDKGSAVLTDVVIERRTVTPYSPVTYGTLCYYTNGFLSMPGGITGLFNIFDVDVRTMMYDRETMKADIEAYGLLSVDDYQGMITEEAYEAFGGRYLGIAVGKGLLTWEEIAALAERYIPLCQ